MRYLNIPSLFTITTITGKHHHILFISLLKSPHHRNRINNSAIEHRYAIHICNRTHIRQAAGCLSYVYNTFPVILLLQITGTPGMTIGGHHFETCRILCIRFIIVWQDFFREMLVKQFLVKDAMFAPQMLDTDIMILIQQIDIAEFCTPSLTGHIRKPVARTRRYSYSVRKPDFVIHQIIQHATGKYPTHASSFQYQSCFIVYFHNQSQGTNSLPLKFGTKLSFSMNIQTSFLQKLFCYKKRSQLIFILVDGIECLFHL